MACKNLRNVQLPSKLEVIGPCAFRESRLRELVLPASMREIGAKAFYRCSLLENVSLNEGLEKLGAQETVNGREYEGGVFECTAIKNIRIPSTLKRLERSTFYHCSDLECVELLSGVEYIGQECFGNSYLQQLMLPSTVKEICENAMDECDYL